MATTAQKARLKHWEERKDRAKETRAELDELQGEVDKLKECPPEKDEEFPDKFTDLPLSQRTLMGLERGNFKRCTRIQSESLPLILAGRDVLGAAKTGSGKTLCFVIPVVERLYRQRWDEELGVGAMILSPTRELALQIFKVLQVVGCKHTFSAALLTGGRNVEEEKKRLHAINIIVGTPGRVLHHLSEDSGLVVDNLQILVMDEADRLLDMGFRETLRGILQALPKNRQTILFSATQTTDVQALAEMSLKDPVHISAHANSVAPTPTKLCQNFIVVELHRKLDALLMFLKHHPNDKIIVFVSTCNQVKFMYLAFSKILKKMRIPSMCLTGKMKQFRRDEIFTTFCRCKAAVLFCTDIAARGLDFPMVHWVVQYDCPDSVQTYLHRAGRTARAGARGVCLLLLTPQEVPMLSYLHARNIPLREIAIRPHFMQESRQIFVALVVQGLKYEAQKAFIGYLRSVYFAANKNVFDVSKIDQEKFAASLGLPQVPDTKELRDITRSGKNIPWDIVNRAAAVQQKTATQLTRRERHLEASDLFNSLQVKQRYAPKEEEGDGRDGDIFTKVARPQADVAAAESKELTFDERAAGLSKNKLRKLVRNEDGADLRVKDLGLSRRTVFHETEEGQAVENDARQLVIPSLQQLGDDGEPTASAAGPVDAEEYAEALRTRMTDARAGDKLRRKDLRKARELKKSGKDGTGRSGTGAGSDGESESGESSAFGMDNADFSELMQAAKGELFEESSAVLHEAIAEEKGRKKEKRKEKQLTGAKGSAQQVVRKRKAEQEQPEEHHHQSSSQSEEITLMARRKKQRRESEPENES